MLPSFSRCPRKASVGQHVQQPYETNLGEISVPREVEALKVHVRESREHIHLHIWNGGDCSAV